MSTRENAIEYFIDIASQYDDYYEIKSRVESLFDSLLYEGEVTQEDYDYVLEHWDELLNEHGIE